MCYPQLYKVLFLSSRSWLLYLLLSGFIMGWWMLAFHTHSPAIYLCSGENSQTLALKNSALLKELSPLQRDALQSALAGHFPLMLEFIDQWDQDAQLLVNKGVQGIQRLSTETYLQAHILGHLLQQFSPAHVRTLNCKMNLEHIQDDSGHLVSITDSFQRFLPQTYCAASFLLAIAHPHEIIALPKGLRHLHQLYSPDLLAQIPHDIDQTHSEKLYIAQPDLAFIAPYSHPPALEAFRKQNIPLYSIQLIDTVAEIQEALMKVGHASNHVLEAQLLSIFMEASFLSLDNRLQALKEQRDFSHNPRRMLYLSYHQHYMLPTTKCLTGQLITRALQHCSHLSCLISHNQKEWQIPFEQEQILHIQPDYLIISTPYETHFQHILHHQQALHQSKAFKSHRIFYLDETIQESPTQYIVLAYFDLCQALTAAHFL